jgi:hypothetical protein
MADQLKLRGGPTAEAQVFIGAEREVTVDTGLKALRIHDGVTPGGHLVELATSAASSRSVVAVDATNARDALRVALEAAIATAEANRAAAVTAVEAGYQAGDTATLASANSYTDTAISDLLGGSPELLNTLNELAEAIGDDADFITTINASIAAVQADVDANEAAALAARNAIQADVDANEAAATTAIATGDAATLASANAYTDTSISNLTNGADAALDTLKEIGDALAAGDQSVTDALTSSITTESTARAAADTALSDRLDVLEADSTTQTLLDAEGVARAAAISAEETARIAADAAILASANSYTDTQISNLTNGADAALDTLKEIGDALSAGDSSVTSTLTTQITTESTTRAAADTALSGRLDTLEADPTTQTLLSAETAARVAADATLSSRLDVLEVDPTTASAVAAVQADADANAAAIVVETNARNAAISSEAATRAAADAAETTARQNAITAEENARIAADNTLTTNLATTNSNLTATNTAYAAADTNLQTQIDAIEAVEAAMEARNLRAGLCFGELYVGDLVVA